MLRPISTAASCTTWGWPPRIKAGFARLNNLAEMGRKRVFRPVFLQANANAAAKAYIGDLTR